MKFLVRSGWGESLALARRIEAEGNDVRFSIAKPEAKAVGDGLIRKSNDLPGSASWADVIVFDSNEFTLPEEAERLRKAGKVVVGSSALSKRLEEDRAFALDLARRSGLEVPDYAEFSGKGAFRQARAFMADRGDDEEGWVWKPDDPSISSTYVSRSAEEMIRMLSYWEHCYAAQKPTQGLPKLVPNFILTPKIEGIEVSTEGWFNGKDFFLVNQTIEKNRFFNGDMGEKTGCEGNVVWAYGPGERCELFERLVRPLTTALRGQYNGPFDVNAMIEEESNEPIFLEFTPRFGYDAIYALMGLVDDFSGAIWSVGSGNSDSVRVSTARYSGTVRIHIPPYPEHDPDAAVGVPIFGFEAGEVRRSLNPVEVRINSDGETETSGPDGYVFTVGGIGRNPRDAILQATANIKELCIPLMRYRTDLADTIAEHYQKLIETGLVKPSKGRVFGFRKDEEESEDLIKRGK